ncbi:MAG TPA: hypothetical protein DD377_00040 [Firmicutes bacterium]|nr:hypothetical protein [Bacillota bacterium]HBM69804.1 hypothetical protein [Bacillota bacterium]
MRLQISKMIPRHHFGYLIVVEALSKILSYLTFKYLNLTIQKKSVYEKKNKYKLLMGEKFK